MRPEDRDTAYLWDMRQAARDAVEIAQALSLERLKERTTERRALVNAIQEIGEAARQLSPSYRDAHPEIPWSEIIGMRHRLVHDYRNLNLRILWSVVSKELPPLIEKLGGLLAE